MRFAIKTAPQHTTWAEMLPIWQAADDIELFESGWVFDHFCPIVGDTSGPCLEGWTVLAALAQATRRAPHPAYAHCRDVGRDPAGSAAPRRWT